MIKVSIIVPVYNTEKYIIQCLESIANQTFEHFECIIVDDGSEDGSPFLCDEFCKRDNRFQVIHKQNSGPAAARNTGLDIARGEYICFADSDDYVHPQWLEILVMLLECNNSNAAFVNLQQFSNNDKIKETFVNISEIRKNTVIYSKVEIFSNYTQLINENCLFYGFMYTKIFRRELFDNLRFPENLYCYEDVYLMADFFKRSNRIVTLDLPLYYYRQNPQSILHSENRYLSKKMNYFQFIIHTAEIVEKEGYKKEANKLRQIFVRSYLEVLHVDYVKRRKDSELKQFIADTRRIIKENWSLLRNNPLTTRMFMLCLFINRFSVSVTAKLSSLLFDT